VPDETIPDSPPRQAPWIAALHAARANIVPGLIVQSVMLAIFLAYKYYPPTTLALNHLADLKGRWGYGYSAIASIIAGGLIPELLRIGVFQRGKILHRNVDNLCFSVPFWCFMGVVVDGFYRAQAVWFGAEAVFPVVLTKVIIDQFVYNPLFAAPLTAALYDWKNRGYGLHEFGGFFKVRYYRDVVVPTLFATWGVWIPVVSILYSLPSLLQIPLFALALSMWVTLYTWMSERRIDEGRAHLR
jgi:hypothetical protein